MNSRSEDVQMESFDALVVGGGPAGSTCAWQLKRAGLSVAIVDKRSFPRDKVCAGWVTPEVLAELELDPGDYARSGRVLQPIRAFRTGPMGGQLVETRYGPDPVSYGIRRVEFDHYLLQRSGAVLKTGITFKTMKRDGDSWVVNDAYRAPVVVGAGGHFCPVARELGAKLGASEKIVAAHEIEFEMSEAQRSNCRVSRDTPELFFCPDLQGYGWIFRKADVLNIGLGREDNRNIGDHVKRFCDSLIRAGKIPADLPSKFKGHAYILYGRSRRRCVGDAVLLVGDSIGLAYTQSGEGIRPAVESALIAARLIMERQSNPDALSDYERQLQMRFGERGTARDAARWIPTWVREAVAARLLGNRWFAKNFVLDRWFLHRDLRPLTVS